MSFFVMTISSRAPRSIDTKTDLVNN
jgi:hypothetical protein